MFKLSWTSPSKLQGEIYITELQRKTLRLGPLTDCEGNPWDIHAYYTTDEATIACACPMSQLHPYYYDTSGQSWGLVSQTWKPYKLVVKE